MPDKRLIRTDSSPYHVTAKCQNKEWFDLPLPLVWKLCEESLCEADDLFPIELTSFVLMGNHYHMILKSPSRNLDLFIREFHRGLSLKMGRCHQVFGGDYKWCTISSHAYFMNCYRYVYQNPVRAGLVRKCQDYPFSTLAYVLNHRPFSLPIFDRFSFKDKWGLRWLNKILSDDESKFLKKGLIESEFQKSL